jgi:nicotinate-nucleotide pyrophosphorylase (carboxylating)
MLWNIISWIVTIQRYKLTLHVKINMTLPSTQQIKIQVQQALSEDIGDGDVTADLISPDKQARAQLLCREEAILCGREWFENAFKLLDNEIKINWFFAEGQRLKENDIVCEIKGNARHILSAERTALNFLQSLSGTATLTNDYVTAIAGTGCKILDTRKTIPGLRLAQKYAVSCGGGVNHRVGLYDMVLIKENHIHAAGSIQAAVNTARKNHPLLKIEVEAENIDELQQAIECNVDRVLLDNMDFQTLKEAVKLTNKRTALEASGNITLKTIREVAETGVDFISTGAITKNIIAIDFSLRFVTD